MLEAPILICYDGSDASRRAVEAAAVLLGPTRAVVVDVGPALTFDETVAVAAGELGSGEFEELNSEAALDVAGEGADRARAAGFDAEARSIAVSPAWEGIVEMADEIDAPLIVVGGHRHRRFRGRFESSTSHDLAVHAGRPVLIVPPGERA